MSNNRQKYDEEFKKKDVRLSSASSKTVKEAADDWGVPGSLLYRWRKRKRLKVTRHNAQLWKSIRNMPLRNVRIHINLILSHFLSSPY